MADRYTKLFSLPADLYAAGSPVIIAAGNLLKDSQTGETLAQLKIQSIAKKTIKAATVCIVPLDTVGKPLGETITHQYLDLCVNRDSGFGQKVPIKLPDSSTRAFSVSVTEVIFTDNSIWTGDDAAWDALQQPKSLSSLTDSELAKQFRIEYGGRCNYFPLEQKDLWHCACGAVNHQEETGCHKCRMAHARLRAIDLNDLQTKSEKRVAQERQAKIEQAEKDAVLEKERRNHLKKITALGTAAAVICITVFCILTMVVIPRSHYKKAESFLVEGNTAMAAIEFGKAKNFSNAKERSFELWDHVIQREVISMGGNHTVALKNDGTVLATEFNRETAVLSFGYDGQCSVYGWTDIVALSAGHAFTVGLKSNGNVVMCGDLGNRNTKRNVKGWKNVVAISAGKFHVVGLKADGTVLATGLNDDGQCNVSGWKDVIAVVAGYYHTVGLKSDGTVVATGNTSDGRCSVRNWKDIAYIAAGYDGTAGIKKDGTVVATEEFADEVKNWTNMAVISCGLMDIYGVTKEGTTKGVEPSQSSIAALAADSAVIMLRRNGTLAIDGELFNDGGRLNVKGWSDIKVPLSN